VLGSPAAGFVGLERPLRCESGVVVYTGRPATADELLERLNRTGRTPPGVSVPLILRRLGIDPALAGGVVLTTVTDTVGFASLLGLGALFLT
jgi:magnesium transporter